MKKMTKLIVLVMMISLFVVCNGYTDIVGTWYQYGKGHEDREITFYKDGSFKYWRLAGTYSYLKNEQKGMLNYDNRGAQDFKLINGSTKVVDLNALPGFDLTPEEAVKLIEYHQSFIIVHTPNRVLMMFKRKEMGAPMGTLSDELYSGLLLGLVVSIIFIGYKLFKKKHSK